MRKILKLLIIILSILPSLSAMSCISKKQQELYNFVNGYFSSQLFFNDKYQFVTQIKNSHSQGKIHLVSKQRLDDNNNFLSMLKDNDVSINDFIKQWNFLVNNTAKKLNVISKKNQYNFSNFDIYDNDYPNIMKVESKNNIKTLSWNVDLNFNGKLNFDSSGTFIFNNWTYVY